MVTASREGGASLNILSGLVAGNFAAYWLGIAIISLMAGGYAVSTLGLGDIMVAPAIFAFGLIAFGFLGMGPVTIAVDSYGPVTDNAQSVYELSTIETLPNIKQDIKKEFGFEPDFENAKVYLEENDGAGNTFKATAKPVLIGTAVVGATTLIFSIIQLLSAKYGTTGPAGIYEGLSIMNPLFLLGLITGGAVIYWFSGASCQAVTTGAYRAVEFIKRNIKLEGGGEKASVEDSKKVVEICTQYAQKGMFNIFLAVFFSTLAFACVNHYFFIGYLISIAIFGLYQAIFMANAGGAWDNAKKLVETELNMKGTELHAATVVGDTVGRPVQGHLVGRHEPDHQVHHAVRAAGGRAGDHARPDREPHPCGGLLPHLHGLRLAVVLRDADQDGRSVSRTATIPRHPGGPHRGPPAFRHSRSAPGGITSWLPLGGHPSLLPSAGGEPTGRSRVRGRDVSRAHKRPT